MDRCIVVPDTFKTVKISLVEPEVIDLLNREDKKCTCQY